MNKRFYQLITDEIREKLQKSVDKAGSIIRLSRIISSNEEFFSPQSIGTWMKKEKGKWIFKHVVKKLDKYLTNENDLK